MEGHNKKKDHQNMDTGECMICYHIKKVNFIMIPCGHNGVCKQCLNDISNQNKTCPLCN